MNPLMDWWELVWNTYTHVVALAWAMGGVWGLLIVVLATVAAFAAGVVAPLVVLGGLVALVFTVGMKAAVAVLFLYLFATLLSAPNRPRTPEEVQAFMRANPGLTAEEALARMPKPLRSRDTQLRLRMAPAAAVHDRHVIDGDRVLQIGGTAHPVGGGTTVVSEPVDLGEDVRRYYRMVWKSASRLANYKPGGRATKHAA